MKKILAIIILLLGIVFLSSCKAGSEDPIVDPKEENPIEQDPVVDSSGTNINDNDPTKENDPPAVEDKIIRKVELTIDEKDEVFEVEVATAHVEVSSHGYNRYYKGDNKDELTFELDLVPLDGYKFAIDGRCEVVASFSSDYTHLSTTVNEDRINYSIVKTIDVVKDIKISLDTSKYKVESLVNGVSVEIVKPLDYINIIIEIRTKLELSANFSLIVYNVKKDKEEEISFDDFEFEVVDGETIITYKIDDPNWTPYY